MRTPRLARGRRNWYRRQDSFAGLLRDPLTPPLPIPGLQPSKPSILCSLAPASRPRQAMLSPARGTNCLFPADNSSSQRQFRSLWWQALGCIFAEEHSNVFLYEPGRVIGSQDHACFEAQRCIGKQLYDHTVRMKPWRSGLREDGDAYVLQY